MRRWMIMLLAVCVIAVLTASMLAWNLSNSKATQLRVDRNFDNPEGERALTAAESADYATITSFERFNGPGGPEAYIHPEPYLAYTYANFVDTEVINYYQTRYNYQLNQTNTKGITLNYVANVTKLAHLHIFNCPDQSLIDQNQTIPWRNNAVVFYDIENSAPLMTTNFMSSYAHVFYKNQSEYQTWHPEIELNFSDCYFIEMNFQYSEYYAPTAAFFSDVYQIVILDKDLVPLWIGISAGQAVS
ncbi:MAG: hypothetical protein LBH74_04735 [Nitrososphaerota archaeon]|nr:hypothetical protein [Nitrososphaerota archaeon]